MFIGQRGQFFSPDVMAAVGVFLFALAFFWSASSSIYSQTELIDLRRTADEGAHMALNNLVLSAGEPTNWVSEDFLDINSFGLAKSPNVLDREKTVALMNNLNSDANYQKVKEKLGLGVFDFRLVLLDSAGAIFNESGLDLNAGNTAANPKLILIYKRAVYYDGEEAVLEGIVSLAS
ncbi:Uncharacterised protein [uncultured archaeon]|nr:Uncharacterised protein [uncultured archaeon]